MGALTPQIVMDLESNMQVLVESEYARFTANSWWQRVAKVRSTGARRDILTWLLNTATIRDLGEGGNQRFEDLIAVKFEIENKFSGNGLRLKKSQLTDTDGNGMDLAGEWAASTGAYMGYWPQKQAAFALKNGHTAALFTAYDGKALFATDHPVNPLNVPAGTYSNRIANVPIDYSVTRDIALKNLGTVYSTIRSVKMPNGEDPRMINPIGIAAGPTLFPLVAQLQGAKVIAQAAATGGGGADVTDLISTLGFREAIDVPELAGFESDTTYFVICEQARSSQVGPLVYVEREPFKIDYYTGNSGGTGQDAILGRGNELEWQCQGRNVMVAGHPYLIFKCVAGA